MDNLIEDEEEKEIEKDGFFRCCAEIFNCLQPPDIPLEEMTIISFIVDLMRPDVNFLVDILKKSELKFEGETAEATFDQLLGMVIVISFVLGFTMDHSVILQTKISEGNSKRLEPG
jgi:hypothetical protein